MNKQDLNQVYGRLDVKAHELSNPFLKAHGAYNCKVSFQNGHFTRNVEGDYDMDLFPIPVVSVDRICDIWVELDQICVSTKMDKEDAMKYDYEKLLDFEFEVYENNDPRTMIYHMNGEIGDFKKILHGIDTNEIDFSFYFPQTIDGVFIYGFIKFLKREGFFY